MQGTNKKKPPVWVSAFLLIGLIGAVGLIVTIPLLLMRGKNNDPEKLAEDTRRILVAPSAPDPVKESPKSDASPEVPEKPTAVTEATKPEATKPEVDKTPEAEETTTAEAPETPSAPDPTQKDVEKVSEKAEPAKELIVRKTIPVPDAPKEVRPDAKPMEERPSEDGLAATKTTKATVETMATPSDSDGVGASKPPPVIPKSQEMVVAPRTVSDEIELESFRSEVRDRINTADDQAFTSWEKQAARDVVRSVNDLIKVGVINWDSGSAIDSKQDAVLSAFFNAANVKTMLERQESVIIVLGFADSVGSDAKNLKLAEDRAKSVVSALEEKGIENRTYAFGLGETTVIDSSNERNNRAAEIWVALSEGR